MIRAEKLYLEIGSQEILRNISFTISDGEKIGLVGNNGAGKTTLLRLIVGEILPDRGKIKISGHNTGKVSYIPQYLTPNWENDQPMNVLTYVLEGRGLVTLKTKLQEIKDQLDQYQELYQQYLDREGYQADDQVIDILSGVGLDQIDLEQPISTLSGGQKSRLAIARLLYENSDVLLLDEPTNHLDEQATNWIGHYLATSNQSVVAVSHDNGFLDQFVNRIMYLDREASTIHSYSGTYSQAMRSRSNIIRAEENNRANTLTKVRQLKQFINSATQSETGLKHSREKELKKIEINLSPSTKRREAKIQFVPQIQIKNIAMSTSNIKMSYENRTILSNISLSVDSKERLGIVGVNGVGKTTLLRILAGDMKPDCGTIEPHRHLDLGWYHQEQEGLHDNLTVFNEVKLVSHGKTDIQIRSALAHFLLADHVNQIVGTLSRGERNRLVMCKLMIVGPNLLLLDEPTNHLDRPTQARLMEALNGYTGAIVIVSHDLAFLSGIGVEWVLQLPSGKLVDLSRYCQRY